jgi:hypothetical protein
VSGVRQVVLLGREKDVPMPTFADVVTRMRIELAEAKETAARWQGEANIKGSLAKLEVRDALKRVETAALQVESKLDDVERDAGNAWERMKHGLDKSWDDLKHSLTEAKKHFS